MTRYNALNVNLFSSQLDKLKPGNKNNDEDSNNENNFLQKLQLTNTNVSRLCKAFANGSSSNLKLWKTQLHKMRQSR